MSSRRIRSCPDLAPLSPYSVPPFRQRSLSQLHLTGWLPDMLSEYLTHWLTNQITSWSTDRPTDWQTDWLTDCLIDWLTDWLNQTDRPTSMIDWLPASWMTERLTCQLTYLMFVAFASVVIIAADFKGANPSVFRLQPSGFCTRDRFSLSLAHSNWHSAICRIKPLKRTQPKFSMGRNRVLPHAPNLR